MNESTARTVDEKYVSATHASNLRACADEVGQVDPIIAAGMCQSRLGMALLRLHSEYDSTPHPRKMTDAAIGAYAVTLDGAKDNTASHKQNLVAAHHQAEQWHIHELKLMLGRLKSLPDVREELALTAHRFGMEHPREVAVGVLAWWVDSVCGMCHGRQNEKIKDAPILATAVCPACRGSGKRLLPYGEAGKRLSSHIDDCLNAARASLKKRLRRV